MDDVSLSVMESICLACFNHPAASKLATNMLYQTQVFINDLCGWVDSFYFELMKTSQVPPNEAWILVASCLRKFFEVFCKFRAPADCANSKLDNSHNFRGHPAVAPAITLHVFKIRVTLSAFDKLAESLRSMEKKISDLQKNFDKMHDRWCVESLQQRTLLLTSAAPSLKSDSETSMLPIYASPRKWQLDPEDIPPLPILSVEELSMLSRMHNTTLQGGNI